MRLGDAVADIGDYCNPALVIQPDPSAPGLQVAASTQTGPGPARQRGSGASGEFVTIAGQQQPPARVDVMGKCDDAHVAIVACDGDSGAFTFCTAA